MVENIINQISPSDVNSINTLSLAYIGDSVWEMYVRNFVMLIICAVYILIRGSSFLGEKRNRKLLLMRSVFGYMGVIFNFYAIIGFMRKLLSFFLP